MKLTSILCSLLCIGLLSPSANALTQNIRVGVYENEPKIFTDAQGAESGIMIDLLKEIAAKENWQIDYVHCQWVECLRLLEKGEIDLLPDVAYSDDRSQRFDFHKTPALFSWSQVYRSKEADIASIPDLQGMRIALLGGGIQEEAFARMIEGFGIEAQQIRTKTLDAAFETVRSGHADAAIASHYFGDLHKDRYGLVETGIVFQPSRLYFATRHGSNTVLLEKIEENLSLWHKDPDSPYFAIIKRWGGQAPSTFIPPALLDALYIISGVLFLSLLGAAILRRQVKVRTQQLLASHNQLQSNHAMIKMAGEVARIGGWSLSLPDYHLTWSDEICLIHELPPGSQPTYEQAVAFYPGEHRERIQRLVDRCVHDGTPYDEELSIITAKGTALWIRTIGQALRDETGLITGIEGAFQDISELKLAQEEKHTSETRYQQLFHSMATGFALHEIICDADGTPIDYRFLEANAAFETLTGLKVDELIGHRVSEVIPTLEPFWIERYGQVALTGNTIQFEHYVPEMGKNFDVLAYSPEYGKFATLFTDTTARHRIEAELRESEEKYRLLTENINDVIWTLDAETLRFIYISPSVFKLRGYTVDEIMAQSLDATMTPESARLAHSLIEKEIEAFLSGESDPNRITIEEIEQPCKDGSTVWTEVVTNIYRNPRNGRIEIRGVSRNITERKKAEEHIEKLAHFDLLTGLPNRSLLTERFRYAASLAQRNDEQLAVMFLDLDHFKDVNDMLGHTVGDRLLMEVSKRLKQTLRDEDTVSRQGGDEFILILPGIDESGAVRVATKLLEVVAQPYLIDHYELSTSLSIGIVIYPLDGTDFETLCRNADIAMYQVKQDSRNNFRFFTPEMQAHSARTLQLGSALRQALARNELRLHFQPQFSIADGSIIGAEALLRWRHPELGDISPAEFIPVAESSGQIIQIGEWALRNAARQLKEWMNKGMPPMMMAVNLSAAQFRQPNLPELITQILDEVGLPHKHLELELTEAVAMDDPQAASAMMDKLDARGIRMSIDDFGTGYSSLSYLKRFKIYKLKIDQSFVRDITVDPDDKAIVTAIINMAGSLGMQTIAEGVETSEQLELLRLHGCNEAQGYYFSKPLPAERFENFIKEHKI